MIVFKRLILNISSLRFAILLIMFIAICSGLGTFIPQGNSSNEYINQYNENPIFGIINGKIFLFLELDHIYSSTWFLLSLILLCISLAACSFRRQIPSLKSTLNWIEFDNPNKFEKLELASSWETLKSKELILSSDKLLKGKGWNCHKKDNSISARKGIIGKLGPIIVHIGLIFLLIGSAYGNLANETKEQFLRPNEVLNLINDSSNEELTIKLKNFFIERELDGKPKQFMSNLYFETPDSNEIEIRKTEVNHPIRYKGLTIYQADWKLSNVVLKIDNIIYQIELKPILEISDQIWGVLIEIGKENPKNFLLTVDNENGPVKFFDTSDFEETDYIF